MDKPVKSISQKTTTTSTLKQSRKEQFIEYSMPKKSRCALYITVKAEANHSITKVFAVFKIEFTSRNVPIFKYLHIFHFFKPVV